MNLTRFHTKKSVYEHETERTEHLCAYQLAE